MKLTIQSGADHTEVVRYESDAVGFVAISGVVHWVIEYAITLSRETTR